MRTAVQRLRFLHRGLELSYLDSAPDTVGCGESDISPRQRDYQALRIVGDHWTPVVEASRLNDALLKHLPNAWRSQQAAE